MATRVLSDAVTSKLERLLEPWILGLEPVRLLEGGAGARAREARPAMPLASVCRRPPGHFAAGAGPGRLPDHRRSRALTSFSASGRQVTFRDIPAGDWFGDLAAIDGLSRSADIVALDNALVAAMPPAIFRDLLHSHQPFATTC